nr:uncharacterized protein LOC123276066 [Equus asinus]
MTFLDFLSRACVIPGALCLRHRALCVCSHVNSAGSGTVEDLRHKSRGRRLQFPESELSGDPASLSAHLPAPRRSKAACGRGPRSSPRRVSLSLSAVHRRRGGRGSGRGASGRRARARARARRGARGCWAAVLGGVGGVSEPRLPAQSRARRSPAALCCSLPGQARSSVPPASVDAAPCPRWAQQPGPSTAMTACLRRPSFSSRSSCSPDTDDQGAREDDSIWERKSGELTLGQVLPFLWSARVQWSGHLALN